MPILCCSKANARDLAAIGDQFMVKYAHKTPVGEFDHDKLRSLLELKNKGCEKQPSCLAVFRESTRHL